MARLPEGVDLGAAIALRSWDALTPYGPLVGQATQLAAVRR